MSSDIEVLAQGLDALDLLDASLVGKARRPSVLTQTGFLREVFKTFRAYLQDVDGAMSTARVQDEFARIARTDWEKTTVEQRAEQIQRLEGLVESLPRTFTPGIEKTTRERSHDLFTMTHRTVAGRHKEITVTANFGINQRATRAAEALKTSTSIFIAPEYARRGKVLGVRAQDIISRGVARGAGRTEIADELSRAFGTTARAAAYWETVAAVHTSRARSFSTIWSYADAGITEYEIVTAGDERVTPICQDLEGKIFSVQHAMERFTAFEEEAGNIEDVRAAMPFMRVRGGEIRMINPDGSIGRKTSGLGAEELAGLGFSTPPFHHRCRTQVVPVV